jgi:8-oxo-dGTP diphosphatase
MQFTIPETSLRDQAAQDGMTHLSTGIAISRGHKILLLRREPSDFMGGTYELPGGGIDDGESFETAVRREAFEETGLTVTKIVGMFDGFDYTTNVKPKVRQFNVIVEVEPADVVLSPEHDDFAWVTASDVARIHISADMSRCVQDALRLVA